MVSDEETYSDFLLLLFIYVFKVENTFQPTQSPWHDLWQHKLPWILTILGQTGGAGADT